MTKANLEDHKSSRHNDGVKSFFCDVCVKAFATKSLLFAHRKEQHETPESERRIKCKSCDFYAAGPRNLRKHMEIHDLNAYKKVN